MDRPHYILLGSAPVGPIAEKYLNQSDYPPVATISDTSLTDDELIDVIEKHKAGFVLVVGYGKILKQVVLDSVAGQVLNIHPSLLPEYRGPAPVIQAVLDGVEETGVSVMEIDAKMDHGPLLAQENYRITGLETLQELYEKLVYMGVQLFLENIDAYLDESLELLPQAHAMATITHFIKKEDGLINLTEEEPDMIERKVRAFADWPKTWIEDERGRLILHKVRIQQKKLVIEEVQPEGKRRMSFKEYCAGLRIKPQDWYLEHDLPIPD